VEDAERAGLILSTSHRADDDHFIFAHELIRQTLLTDLSPPRRRRLHARAAEALERAHAASLTEHAAAIAHHLLEAGAAADPKRTFHYLAMAGESAMAAAAYEDALRHFENASPTKHLAGPREAADCLYGLGRAQRSLGRWDEAMDSFREALDAYAALGDTDREGQLCWQLAWQLNYQARWGEAIEIAQRGLASLGDVESPARAALLGLVGFVLGFTGQYEAGRETIDAALAVAEKVGDRLALGQALYAADIFNWGYARFNEAVDTGSRAAALLKESAALWDYAHAALFVQLSLHTLGRWDEAADLHEEVDPLADRIAHHFVVLVSRRERGARERQRTTDLARYEEFARGDLELNRTTGMGWIGQSYIFLALFDFWQGRWTQALTNIREGTRLESTGGISLWAPSLQLLITAYAGDPKETADLFRKLSAQLPQPGQEASIGSWQLACSAVEALAVIGEREQAASLYPLMAAAIESGLVVDGYIHGRPMHMLAGIAAGADRRWADAEGHYRAALEVAGRLGQRMERPDILRFYASMLLERGAPEDQQQARQLLEEALETYREMSMPRHVAMAEALLRNSEVGRDD
jgi:tetratricopeptide (TPR) repeat protein